MYVVSSKDLIWKRPQGAGMVLQSEMRSPGLICPSLASVTGVSRPVLRLPALLILTQDTLLSTASGIMIASVFHLYVYLNIHCI